MGWSFGEGGSLTSWVGSWGGVEVLQASEGAGVGWSVGKGGSLIGRAKSWVGIG